MNKIKTAVLVLLAFVIGFVFCACATEANAGQNNPLKIWGQNSNGNYHTMKVVDDNTGVNYVVVATDLGGGHRSIAICPRYNADGTLYVGG